jgi:hypothetical protein
MAITVKNLDQYITDHINDDDLLFQIVENSKLEINYQPSFCIDIPGFMINVYHERTFLDLLIYASERWINHYRIFKEEFFKYTNVKNSIEIFFKSLPSLELNYDITCSIDFLIDLGFILHIDHVLILYRANKDYFRNIFKLIKNYVDMKVIQKDLTNLIIAFEDYTMLKYCYQNGFIMSKNIFNDAIKENNRTHLEILCECECPSYNKNDKEYDIYDPISHNIVQTLLKYNKTLPYSICYNAMRNKNKLVFDLAHNLKYDYKN